ncbi:MAG: carbohydrate kinase [Chloroflexota bacterium]|nr:carbohydrate kinase [Chloroflexota bacterium]
MKIVTLGELLIDMFPAEVGCRLVEVSAFHPKPGGAPANVAVAARRLGATTAFIGKVGDDAFGRFLIDVLRQQGVETRGMRIDEEARTTMAVIAMPDENSAEFVFYRNPGADQRLRPDELDRDLLASAKALHFGSLSLTHEPSRAATHEAVTVARQAGALVSYDVNYRPSLWESPEKAVAQAAKMVPRVDLLKANETELGLLTDGRWSMVDGRWSIQEAAKTLLERGPSLVVVTLGPGGSYVQTAQGGRFIPAFPVDTVDAVGCGDAFIAGVLVQLTAGADWQQHLELDQLESILRYASAVGALTATKQGVIPALPTARQVEVFLADRLNQGL